MKASAPVGSDCEARNYVIIPLGPNWLILGDLLRGLRYGSQRGPAGAYGSTHEGKDFNNHERE